jgi:hypothetical protein
MTVHFHSSQALNTVTVVDIYTPKGRTLNFATIEEACLYIQSCTTLEYEHQHLQFMDVKYEAKYTE